MKTIQTKKSPAIIEAFKAVFVSGNGSSQQKAIVFVIIFVPIIVSVILFGHPATW